MRLSRKFGQPVNAYWNASRTLHRTFLPSFVGASIRRFFHLFVSRSSISRSFKRFSKRPPVSLASFRNEAGRRFPICYTKCEESRLSNAWRDIASQAGVGDYRPWKSDQQQNVQTAVQVFETLAGILFAEKTPKIKTGTHQLRSKYVGELAAIWRRAGLKPSRANHPSNPNYRSKFHRFAEFVLTEIAQPQSRRHDPNIEALVAPLAPMDLPEEIRRISRAPRHVDQKWLISDDHLRTAFRGEIIEQDSISNWHLIPWSKLACKCGIGIVPSTEGGKRNPQSKQGPRPYCQELFGRSIGFEEFGSGNASRRS